MPEGKETRGHSGWLLSPSSVPVTSLEVSQPRSQEGLEGTREVFPACKGECIKPGLGAPQKCCLYKIIITIIITIAIIIVITIKKK